MSGPAVFFIFIIAMFPALILVALVAKLLEIREASRWPSTSGKVVASRVSSRRNRPGEPGYNFSDTEVSNDPFVEYEYKVGSRTYRSRRISIAEKTSGTELESILERYPVGATVTVYFDPATPSRALLERTLPLCIMVAGGSVVLLFFIGVPVVAAILYFNALSWLKPRVANPGRAPLVAITCVFGLAVSLFAIVFERVVRRASAWPVTRGKVVASGVERFRDRRDIDTIRRPKLRYKSGVSYSYEVNGRTFYGDRLTIGVIVSSSIPGIARRTAARYPVGTEVDVHYNPNDPGESVLHPRSALHHLLWVVAVALFAFAWALGTGRFR